MKKEKTILLLTGMHRSGTSLLGGLVNAIGIDLPGRLIKGDIYNIDGYYEREDIVEIQEDLLISLGRWWPTIYGCEEMPKNWISNNNIVGHKKRLKEIIQNIVNDGKEITAFKDPRSCLLIPLWKQIAVELDVELKVIASIRSPAEVIVSLMNRDKETTGMTEARAEKLWCRHNIEMLNSVDNIKYMLIDYSKWFKKEESYKQLENLHQFCLDREITNKVKHKAYATIKNKYRRSNDNMNGVRPLITKKTWVFYEMLSKASCEKKQAKRHNNLKKLLIYIRRKDNDIKIDEQWFSMKYYKQQLNHDLNEKLLKLHYGLIGWRKTISPNLLFEPNHYKHNALLKGENVEGCPFIHFSKYSLWMKIEPNSVTYYDWIRKNRMRIKLFKAAELEGMHPWAAASVAVNNGSKEKGLKTLKIWLKDGLKQSDLTNIINSDVKYFSHSRLSAVEKEEPLPTNFNVICDSCGIYNWQLYSWVDLLYHPREYNIDKYSSNILYLITGSYSEIDTNILIKLSISRWIYCTNTKTIKLLKRLGINAKEINRYDIAKYSTNNENDKLIAAGYGFPNPLCMRAISNLVVVGELEEKANNSEYTHISYLPNPNSISIINTKDAISISRWFTECCLLGLQLVWITDNNIDIKSKFWKAYKLIENENNHIVVPELFTFPISLKELMDELIWRKEGFKINNLLKPANYMLKEEINIKSGKSSEVTVCISLYNYAHRIVNALESIKSQTLVNIDLVIVNDNSSDESLTTVINWLSNNISRFNNIKVVSHTKNIGLSTARNTGFELSETEWVFVLDADNSILPLALESIIKLTNPIEDNVAAIYPLIRTIKEDKNICNKREDMMNFTYWNQYAFKEKNIIDAMALVKKSIWERVGGYDNIIGGWEDYDFWCKLIENGYFGLLCPQVLAEYHVHEDSMIATITSQSSRHVSRQLQEKHEWLMLALANEHKIMLEE